MIETTIKRPKDNVTLRLFDKDGNLKQEVTSHNLVVDTGLDHIADQLASTPAESAMSHMAVGTGSTAAAAGNTTLGTESARVALSNRTTTDNVTTYVATFPAGTGTAALQEAGIFNDNTTGTMLARDTFDVINKGASDSLEITWTLTFTAS